MADASDVRRLALSLPHVEEIDSDGFDFRVGGRGFVWSYPERIPGQPRRIRTDVAVLFVGDEAEKQALLLGEPEKFFTAPGYDGWPLVMLRLAEVDTGRLTELVTDAWRMRAPEGLAADPPLGLYLGVYKGLYSVLRWPQFSPFTRREAAMPKINVYLPDDLAESVKEAGVTVSAICQAALELAVRRQTVIRQLVASDLDSETLGARLPRFTNRALTAFRLAAGQARAAGAPLVGTEHLLGGLLAEGGNLALAVLHAMDIETSAIKAELDQAAAGSHPGAAGGPDAGRRISGPLGAALVGAVAASNSLGHNYTGCEHLLLGLISEPEGTGGQVLRALGVDERQARRTVTASLAGIEYWQARAQGGGGQATADATLAEAIKRELQPFADRLATIEQRLSAPSAHT